MANVIIYTTPTCAYCRATKDFFQQHNVQYEEKDVARDRAALEEMMQKTDAMAVPVIDVNGEIVVGFDRERLATLLGVQ